MSVQSIAVLFGGVGILLIVLAFVIVFVVRKLGINHIGSIKLDQNGRSAEYDMNEETRGADDTCRKDARLITDSMKITINNVFGILKICSLARIAIASFVRFPLYESVSNNHFTTELMPENYNDYRERIIGAIKDEYVSLSFAPKDTNCGEVMPPWEQISEPLIECIDLWLKRIIKEVIKTCNKKITIYTKYLVKFQAAKDDFRINIVEKCIEKNVRYIEILKTRIK